MLLNTGIFCRNLVWPGQVGLRPNFIFYTSPVPAWPAPPKIVLAEIFAFKSGRAKTNIVRFGPDQEIEISAHADLFYWILCPCRDIYLKNIFEKWKQIQYSLWTVTFCLLFTLSSRKVILHQSLYKFKC